MTTSTRTPQPRIEIIDGPHYRSNDDQGREWPHHAYRVRLRFQGRQITTAWKQGMGHTEDPEALDVLASLISDGQAAEDARGVWDFAETFGYEIHDEESHARVSALLAACEKAGDDVRRLLGAELYAQIIEHGETEPSDLRRAWSRLVELAR